jgi:hypothetical protein
MATQTVALKHINHRSIVYYIVRHCLKDRLPRLLPKNERTIHSSGLPAPINRNSLSRLVLRGPVNRRKLARPNRDEALGATPVGSGVGQRRISRRSGSKVLAPWKNCQTTNIYRNADNFLRTHIAGGKTFAARIGVIGGWRQATIVSYPAGTSITAPGLAKLLTATTPSRTATSV